MQNFRTSGEPNLGKKKRLTQNYQRGGGGGYYNVHKGANHNTVVTEGYMHFPITLMGVFAPRSVHVQTSAQPPHRCELRKTVKSPP